MNISTVNHHLSCRNIQICIYICISLANICSSGFQKKTLICMGTEENMYKWEHWKSEKGLKWKEQKKDPDRVGI